LLRRTNPLTILRPNSPPFLIQDDDQVPGGAIHVAGMRGDYLKQKRTWRVCSSCCRPPWRVSARLR